MNFKWYDGVLLEAMKKGYWILLDELNLASQSVLEGLNAILDHRGEVYLPETNLTFKKHPNFRIFATQNSINLVYLNLSLLQILFFHFKGGRKKRFTQ